MGAQINYKVNAPWLAKSVGEETTRYDLAKRRVDIEMLERRGVITRKQGVGRPSKKKETQG